MEKIILHHDIENNFVPDQNYPDILCFSHLKWSFVFQRPQHLMVRWAQKARVFFIEEPVPTELHPHLAVQQCSSGVYYITPHLPNHITQKDSVKTIEDLLEALLERFSIENYIHWYYTPMALPFTDHLAPKAIVYDCMDELSHFKGADPNLRENEKNLLSSADVVFTGGHSLYKFKKRFHHNIHPFPSSVDMAHYAKARGKVEDPKDQRLIARPRLGFFGVIDERLDIQLIRELALRRPDWQIVLIGPVVKIDPQTLPRLPNIHYLGQKNYSELPTYLAGWDVAILPFAKNDSTRYISPTKTLEYMAGGKPIVSTSIDDVVNPYGTLNFVRIADKALEFEAAVDAALHEDPLPRQRKADAFLKELSWDKTWGRMKDLVDEVLEKSEHSFQDQSFVRDAYDCVVVGAGLAGSVVAERLASAGKKVLICDRRPHIGGNTYDHNNESGIMVHKYGPHIFHTNSDEVYHYLSNFTEWIPYEHRVLSFVDGKYLPIPINLDTINNLYGWNLNSVQLEDFFQCVAHHRDSIRTSEDVIVSKVGWELYEKFFRNYTRKQWGLDPSQLDATVIARIPVRTNRDDRYFTDKYQVMPAQGFTAMVENILSHPNITQVLGVDYREIINKVSYDKIVYSGPIDLYFDYCYGKLPYRSLDFKFETHNQEIFQPAPVVNYPNDHDYTRITEFKYLTGQKNRKTSVVYEFPKAEGDPYYPIPRPENTEIYRKYHALAEKTNNVHFVGRLGTYKYYNMDQVIAQALTLASRLVGPDASLIKSKLKT